MRRFYQNERGAVSLFIVIFSALLITTITVAFIRIMVQNQQQATTNDLSHSALDSAQAGVEDAKRAIVTLRKHCLNSDGSVKNTTECHQLESALNSGACDTIQQSGILPDTSGDSEVLIRQSEGDELLQQAYTCVKVTLNTVDYVGSMTPNTSRLIPLKATGEFDKVVIDWYSQSDLQTAIAGDDPGNGTTIDLGLDKELPKLADWPRNRPALLRVQLIQFGENFLLSDFNKDKDGKTNNATLFLMPSAIDSTGGSLNFADDVRRSPALGVDQPVLIKCDKNFSATSADKEFACSATIQIPDPIGPDNPDNRTAYLRINTLYNANTTFRVSMQNAAEPVRFSAVQPVVDSTGRANDLFRRIRSRVEVEASSIPPVEASVDVTGSLCKTFLVTDKPEDFSPGLCGTQ